MKTHDLILRYLPPRLVQALLVYLVLYATMGGGTVRRWVEAIGDTAALRLLGVE